MIAFRHPTITRGCPNALIGFVPGFVGLYGYDDDAWDLGL